MEIAKMEMLPLPVSTVLSEHFLSRVHTLAELRKLQDTYPATSDASVLDTALRCPLIPTHLYHDT